MEESTHFIGIGGIGMSALARILLERGRPVSGSDKSLSPLIQELMQLGAEVHIGHTADAVPQRGSVVYSTAITPDNPELCEAKNRDLTLLHRSELLRDVMIGKAPLLVTGTHGKTTTSALLAHTLRCSGLNPAFCIGGVVPSLGKNGGWAEGPYFVAEADESDGSFLNYGAFGAVITNIDSDHLDHWKSMEALKKGFALFAQKITSYDHLFHCKDDENLSELKLPGTSYGFHPDAALCVESFRQDGFRLLFEIALDGKHYADIELPLIGGHNVLNGAAVFGMALRLGLSEVEIRRAFLAFSGVGRRADKRGEIEGALLFDDYAHHPTEIMATLRAFRSAFPTRRLVVAFQPHRFTRTRDCFDLFGEALSPADLVFVTDIYGAGEQPIQNVTTEKLIQRIGQALPVHYAPRDKLGAELKALLQPNDVVLSVGAGDITHLPDELKSLT